MDRYVSIVIPILTLILGWFLNEAHARFQRRSEDKQNIGRALVELLDIRHRLNSLLAVPDLLTPLSGISAEQLQPIVAIAMQRFYPATVNVHEIYERGVAAVSRYDPLLAYRLRSKDAVHQVLGQFFAFQDPTIFRDPNRLRDWGALIRKLAQSVIPLLEEACVLLAKEHGWTTVRAVRKTLRSIPDSAPLDDLVKFVRAQLEGLNVEQGRSTSAE